MSRKILAFLSNQEPKQKYPYAHRGAIYSGSYFPEALIEFCPYDEMLIFVTADARRKSWPYFESLGHANIRAVDIPDGRSSEEIWQIFRTVAAAVQPGDTVVIDITHAMRFLPFLVFLFVSYLKFSGRGALEAIYYGAVQYGPNNTIESASVVDLTEFAKMLEWIGAAEQFTRSGNGAPIAGLLDAQAENAYAARNTDAGDALTEASRIIEHVSRALALNMPLEVSQAAWRLSETLPGLLARGAAFSQQMLVLGDAVRKEYARLGLSSTDVADRDVLIEIVWQQRSMAFTQFRRGALYQAALLVHETLVSAVMVHIGSLDITEYDQRDKIRRTLQILRRMRAAMAKNQDFVPNERTRHDLFDPEISRWLQQLGEASFSDQLARVYGRATKLRNKLAHCGFEGSVPHVLSSLSAQHRDELHEMAKALGPLLRKLLP